MCVLITPKRIINFKLTKIKKYKNMNKKDKNFIKNKIMMINLLIF